jgi:nucleoside-diphosphate-sugar epimerase
MSEDKKTFLVTGGAGYIGSTLTRKLLNKNYRVKVLDRFFFGEESLEEIRGNPNLEMIKEDIREVDPSVMDEVDVVIDMAALSNDPSGEINPEKTWDINYLGRTRIAHMAKLKGVDQYIQASTCSIYGQQDGVADETSEPNPLTTYAKAHRKQEKSCLGLADEDFTVTALRQATVYGYSYRMRFDLAINAMVNAIYENGELGIMRDGTQWRPFVHVKDTARAFIEVAEAEDEKVNGEIFNVGSNEQNYQIKPLAEELLDSFDEDYDWHWYGDPDDRSYRVDFSKIKEVIGFKPKHTPADAAQKIFEKIQNGELEKNKKTITLEWYQHLLDANEQIGEHKNVI